MIAPRRRWFRFSLRTMLILVTACALWLRWQVRIVQERKAVLAELQRVDKGAFEHDRVILETYGGPPEQYAYTKISLLRRLLGDQSCVSMHLPFSMEREWIARAEVAFPEAELWVVSDDYLSYAFRDSLYDPDRRVNWGTLFKTGLVDPTATAEFVRWIRRPRGLGLAL